MKNNTKEVYFHKYCPLCAYYDLSESEDPCWDCLENGANYSSHKPVKYKPKTEDELYGRSINKTKG